MKIIKIGFNSEIAKALSEKANLLAWAVGGINYIGFDFSSYKKAIIVISGWVIFQYMSLILLRVSLTLKKEEAKNDKF